MTSRSARCGSYPFRYIAEDHRVPYHIVLAYAEDAYAIAHDVLREPSIWGHRAAEWVRTTMRAGPRAAFIHAVLIANNHLFKQRAGEK